jgi:hypothetical protein
MKNETAVIAIDPGASGGFAVWTPRDRRITLHAMPDNDERICKILRDVKTDWPDTRVYLELVGGYIQGKERPGSRMFNFGDGYGYLRGCCDMAGMPPQLITPQKWQKPLSVPQGLTGPVRKRWLHQEAQRHFPKLKITLKTCDALLLLEFVRREYANGDASQEIS